MPPGLVSSACRVQVVPERVNTYATPAPLLVPQAPTTAVDPEMATDQPKKSLARPVAASLAC